MSNNLEEEQLRLEDEMSLKAQRKIDSAFIHIIESGELTDTSFGQTLLRISIDAVTVGIKEFFRVQLRGQYRKDRERLKAFYEGREDVLAYIIVNAMLVRVAKHPRGLVALSGHILQTINSLLSLEQHRKSDPKLYAYMDYEFKKRGKRFIESRKRKIARLKGFELDNIEARTKLGTQLIKIVMQSGCNLFQLVGARHTSYGSGREIHTVALSDDAMRLIGKHRESLVKNAFTYQPLVVPPNKPKSVRETGGYKSLPPVKLVKKNNQHLKMIEDDFSVDGRFGDILDKIQNVPWQINTRVMSIMNTIIEDNLVDPSSSKNNPKLYGNIPYMDHLDVDEMIIKADYGKLDETGQFVELKDFKTWYKAKSEQQGLIDAIHGRRMGYLFALDVAKKFSKYREFYYTYQFDYRFRLYPLQQHLNPQMTGNIKALLQFANGQKLNKKGLRWLKIHGANCYGWDKAPYSERISNIEAMEDEIRAVAINPLLNLSSWTNADSPFEFLAFCFSYNDYVNNPDALIHIPVALDAVCSGIQIYSGLLRDKAGAEAVNVINRYEVVDVADDVKRIVRGDIYNDVAVVANRLIEEGSYPKDISFKTSDGEEKTVSTRIEVKGLKGKINRRLTKRNVMTTPYSVTDRGMFDQIKELLDEDEANDNVWWQGDKWIVAKLITVLNIQAIALVVEGATKGQHYIKEQTRSITREGGYLKWKSPIFDLPLIQKVTKFTEHRLRTELGTLVIKKPTDTIHKQKMLSSIAPNFIHQLDAVLMYRTVERCMEDGVHNYWLIHDSYGVSPNDAEALSRNVRLSYKELFEQDILKDWTEQLGLEWDESVMINTLNLDDVIKSEYIFS